MGGADVQMHPACIGVQFQLARAPPTPAPPAAGGPRPAPWRPPQSAAFATRRALSAPPAAVFVLRVRPPPPCLQHARSMLRPFDLHTLRPPRPNAVPIRKALSLPAAPAVRISPSVQKRPHAPLLDSPHLGESPLSASRPPRATVTDLATQHPGPLRCSREGVATQSGGNELRRPDLLRPSLGLVYKLMSLSCTCTGMLSNHDGTPCHITHNRAPTAAKPERSGVRTCGNHRFLSVHEHARARHPDMCHL